MTEDPLTSGQRVASARRAISAYARVRHQPTAVAREGGDRESVQEQDRLAHLLCALRHHADQVATLSFPDLLSAVRQDANRTRPTDGPVNAIRAAACGHALDVYEQGGRMSALHRDSAWQTGIVADLQADADRRGVSFEAAITDLTAALVTDLRRYADRHGIDFEAAIATSHRAYTEQRLREEGPFETGQEPRSRPATLLTAVPAAAIFRPVATHQGVITTFGDAEWHLVRTAARIRDRERGGFQGAYLPDIDDRRILSDALGQAYGLTGTEILRKLTSRIEIRAAEMERGVTAAADLGRVHGGAGTQPYCNPDTQEDATALMRTFGETEWTTDANYPYRLALVAAYTEAYCQASAQAPPAAISPARVAARDFPAHDGQHTTQSDAPTALGSASRAEAKPRTPRR